MISLAPPILVCDTVVLNCNLWTYFRQYRVTPHIQGIGYHKHLVLILFILHMIRTGKVAGGIKRFNFINYIVTAANCISPLA